MKTEADQISNYLLQKNMEKVPSKRQSLATLVEVSSLMAPDTSEWFFGKVATVRRRSGSGRVFSELVLSGRGIFRFKVGYFIGGFHFSPDLR